MTPFVYHAGLYAAAAAFLKITGFIVFLWLARSLTVSEYAAWGLLYALQTSVTSFGAIGVVESVIGLLRASRHSDAKRELFAAASSASFATLSASLAFSAILFLAAANGAAFSLLTIAATLASGGLLAYAGLQAQLVRLDERHLASLWFVFLIPFCGLFGSVVAFAVDRSIASFFLGSTVGLAVSLCGAMAAGIGSYRLAVKKKDWAPVLSRITPFIAVTFLGWLGGYGNTYLINLFFDAEEVAKFTLAFMLSSVMQLVASAMNQVWSPRFYRMVHELPHDEVEIHSRLFLRWQGITLGAVGAIMLILFPWAANAIGGNLVHYRSLNLELLLLVLAYVVVIPYWHYQNYLLAYDMGPTVMKVHIGTGAVGVSTLLLLMWLIGPLGIYLGFLAQMLLRSAGAFAAVRRRWPLRSHWGGVAAGVVLAGVGFGLSL